MASRSLIERAADMERNGRVLDAISELTLANREARDEHLERLLLQLRFRAFGSIEETHPDYVSPTPCALADESGLPAVRGSELTAGVLRAAILDRGALIVKGLVPSVTEVSNLRHGVDRVFEAREQFKRGDQSSAVTPWFQPFKPDSGLYATLALGREFVGAGSGVWVADSPRMFFDITEAYRTIVDTVVTDYLGSRPAVSVNKGTLRRVPPTGGTEWWHQDGAFLGDAIRSLNIWLALSDCGHDAPGLEILPRRLHSIVERGTRGADFDWSVGQEVVDELAGGAPISRPLFAAGDALLFDHRCLHRTFTTATMTLPRYAIETWFFSPSAYPDPLAQVPLVF